MKVIILLCIATIAAGETDIFYGSVGNSSNGGTNFLPPMRNQNQPRACDASWAFAATSAMSTIFNLQKKGAFPEVVLSPQMLINCLPETIKFSCEYGATPIDMGLVLQHLVDNGVSDETCNNYYASDEKNCSDLNQCKDCHNGEDIHKTPRCGFVPYRKYQLANFAKLGSEEKDETKRRAEIFKKVTQNMENGPVVCRIDHSEALFSHRISKPAYFVDDENLKKEYSTWVSVVGYRNKSKDYHGFAVQHSFGENVGYYGIVFLEGDETTNTNNILDNCYSLTVKPEPTTLEKGSSYQSFVSSLLTDKGVKTTRFNQSSLNQGLKLGPVFKKFNEGLAPLKDDSPINWQNKDGKNYLTYVKNQHIPTYCGSCWAQAAAAVLADRLNIAQINSGKSFPKVNLSVQAIINCKEGGSCFGGDSTMLFQRAQNWKVPVESCQTYQAVNPSSFDCPVENVCFNRSNKKDYPFAQYAGVKVTEWGRARGAKAIKQALADGPIVCDFQVTDEFVEYKKDPSKLNIWTKQLDFIAINHAVSVVGWGKDGDTEYWVVRNSWGREWGYDGFFYIQAGENILGIESECSWAKVEFSGFE